MLPLQKEIDTLVDLASQLREAQIKLHSMIERDKKLTQALRTISEKGGAFPGDKKHEIARAALSEE